MTPARPLSPKELAALLADSADGSCFEVDHRPLPAVLDTACVRTGLHFQMKNGLPPRSVMSARNGSLRLLMEYDTLVETSERLPKFAKQLGVPTIELKRALNKDWLPHIDVVKLPPSLRQVDQRALAVRERDADDYPAAALAALLSPCLLLTHNYKDFGALGVRTESQGIDGVLAITEINIGQLRAQAVVMIPTAPVLAVGATAKWASERIGPAAWVILGLLIAGGTYLYIKQPQEQREGIKEVAGEIGAQVLEEYEKATAGVQQARVQLRACVVPKPEDRSRASAILRGLAMSQESLSAQQLSELLDPSLRPSVAYLRAYLRENTKTLFTQVRRGGFVLGRHYELPDS